MKCSFCSESCSSEYCSYYQEGKSLFLADDINIAFMEYYDIDYATAINKAYEEAYRAFYDSVKRGVRVYKWI
jgi:hypothetical protein